MATDFTAQTFVDMVEADVAILPDVDQKRRRAFTKEAVIFLHTLYPDPKGITPDQVPQAVDQLQRVLVQGMFESTPAHYPTFDGSGTYSVDEQSGRTIAVHAGGSGTLFGIGLNASADVSTTQSQKETATNSLSWHGVSELEAIDRLNAIVQDLPALKGQFITADTPPHPAAVNLLAAAATSPAPKTT